MAALEGFVRSPGEGEGRWFHGGGRHIWKATAAQTGGALFAFEDVLEEGKVTPLHCHPAADDVTYVLEGAIEYVMDGRSQELSAGGFVFTPRGVPHAFRVLETPTRLLALQTPGAGDAFYLQASEPATSDEAGPTDFAHIGEVAAATGATQIMGPPPFAP